MTPTVKAVLEAGFGLEGKFVPDYDDLARLVKLIRESGYTIVLTQGVYDMYHVGHSRYLIKARSFGDVLIVGVDSDELTRQMKGESRPFDGFEDRVELLAGFSFINILTRRGVDEHMHDLIKLVEPDVLVMSKTTRSFTDEDKHVLDKHCGRLEHLEPQAPPESVSTTVKIRRLQVEGAQELADVVVKAINVAVAGYLDEGGSNV